MKIIIFKSREILQYIIWACFCNVDQTENLNRYDDQRIRNNFRNKLPVIHTYLEKGMVVFVRQIRHSCRFHARKHFGSVLNDCLILQMHQLYMLRKSACHETWKRQTLIAVSQAFCMLALQQIYKHNLIFGE